MHIERRSAEGPERKRPGCLVAILLGLALVIGAVIWFDNEFIECGPETANDTAGFCQGPTPTSPWP